MPRVRSMEGLDPSCPVISRTRAPFGKESITHCAMMRPPATLSAPTCGTLTLVWSTRRSKVTIGIPALITSSTPGVSAFTSFGARMMPCAPPVIAASISAVCLAEFDCPSSTEMLTPSRASLGVQFALHGDEEGFGHVVQTGDNLDRISARLARASGAAEQHACHEAALPRGPAQREFSDSAWRISAVLSSWAAARASHARDRCEKPNCARDPP